MSEAAKDTPLGFDAYSPSQIAERIENAGVLKTRMPVLSVVILGVLAGVFIGFGAMMNMMVLTDPLASLAATRILGGLFFCIGLIMVVIAGAELFTGNNLIVMAFVDGKIRLNELVKNWIVVSVSNMIGALILLFIVYHSGHFDMFNGQLKSKYMMIAVNKCSLSLTKAYFSGILCNMLVCLAVWMSFAGRTVTDKILAVIFPVTTFVALGFEHSVANMFLIPAGMVIDSESVNASLNLYGMMHNLIPVILGNLTGGGIFVGLVYAVIYRREFFLRRH